MRKVRKIAGLVLLFCFPVHADFPVEPVCLHPASQTTAKVSADMETGDVIVAWIDRRDGGPRVYFRDVNGIISPASTSTAQHSCLEISGYNLVWLNQNPEWDIDVCMKDLRDPNWDWHEIGEHEWYETPFVPEISENRVTWIEDILVDSGNGYYSVDGIYTWNSIDGKQLLYSNSDWFTERWYPDISGEQVVWCEYEYGDYKIVLYDPVHGMREIADIEFPILPRISKGVVVWPDFSEANKGIYMWDAVNGKQLITTSPAWQHSPVVSVDTIVRVVWQDYRNNNSDIYMWDPVCGERAVCSNSASQSSPDISGNYIVWHDNRNGVNNWDIYMARIPDKTLRQDLDCDGVVGFSDFSDFAEKWLEKEDWY